MKDIEGTAYTLIAYSKALKCKVSNLSSGRCRMARRNYSSLQTPHFRVKDILYYRTRFQIEFCFRDAKGYTGLMDCQARDKWKDTILLSMLRSHH